MQSRVSMVGPNGVGKSTLLSLILGDLNPTAGDVRRNHRLRIGRYNQHFVDVLPMDKTPVSYLQTKNPDMPYQKIRNHLGKYGLGGHAHEILLRQCSGGQKARVVLSSLALDAPHILVLDEPTNHLDIETIDALAEGLREFEGGVVLVSHDARLICEAGCELWIVDNKTVTRFDGEFDDYREGLLEQIEEDAERSRIELEVKLAQRAKERAEKLKLAKERSEKARIRREAAASKE
jgi:ATP-binding cassette, subfamily F, member 1